jgi:hypothetical protein
MVASPVLRRPVAATAFGVAAGVMAVAFLVAASTHLGARVPVGGGVLAEPRILPAAIVEGLIGVGFAVAAWLVLTGSRSAWSALVGAHLVGLGGVLLGVAALAAGRGPRTESNDRYHQVMLVLLAAGLVLLATPWARSVLGRANRA